MEAETERARAIGALVLVARVGCDIVFGKPALPEAIEGGTFI